MLPNRVLFVEFFAIFLYKHPGEVTKDYVGFLPHCLSVLTQMFDTNYIIGIFKGFVKFNYYITTKSTMLQYAAQR